jgi:hypothetical protein
MARPEGLKTMKLASAVASCSRGGNVKSKIPASSVIATRRDGTGMVAFRAALVVLSRVVDVVAVFSSLIVSIIIVDVKKASTRHSDSLAEADEVSNFPDTKVALFRVAIYFSPFGSVWRRRERSRRIL